MILHSRVKRYKRKYSVSKARFSVFEILEESKECYSVRLLSLMVDIEISATAVRAQTNQSFMSYM